MPGHDLLVPGVEGSSELIVVGEDFVGPAEDGVDGFAVLGDLAGLVEVGESVQGPVGVLEVGGLVDLV